MSTSPRDNLLSAVKMGLKAGLCILPPDPYGSKRPLPGGKNEWIGYQTTKPTPEELRNWYSDVTVTGIGVVCGHDGLECLDFDERAIFEDYDNAAVSSGLGDLLERIKTGYCEYSPNGVHLLYRCEEISGNTKLATRPKKTEEMKDPNDKTKTLIETRGKGGYIITAPSYGTVNPSGTYQNVSGSFETIHTITPDERKALHELAQTFNQFDDKQLEAAIRQASRDTKSGGRPGDDFNCRARWEDILLKHGWIKVLTIGGTTYWRRPGKAFGISATTNHQGSDLLYVFTSSTSFEPNRGYSKFSAYAILEHGGDFSAAAGDLARQGYGDKLGKEPPGTDHAPEMQEVERKPLFMSATDMLTQPITIQPLIGKVIERGLTGQIFGPSGSGKTFVVLDMACSVATGLHWNGNKCENGLVLYFAGEGHSGLRRRIKAWHRNNGCPDMSNLRISRSTISFDEAGLHSVMSEVRKLENTVNCKVSLIIIDTLARHLQGDENSTRDMSDFVRMVDSVRNAFPASTAIIVHHTGNNIENATRSRGSSALKAAMDFEIQCDKGLLTFTKVKDGEHPAPIEFKLLPTEIDQDEDGEPITSCVVMYGERSAKNREITLTKNEKVLMELVTEPSGLPHGDLKAAFFTKRREHDPDAKQDTLKKGFQRAFEGLIDKKQVYMDGVFVIPGQGQNRDITGTCPLGVPGQTGHTPLGVSRCPSPYPVPGFSPDALGRLSLLKDVDQDPPILTDSIEDLDLDGVMHAL